MYSWNSHRSICFRFDPVTSYDEEAVSDIGDTWDAACLDVNSSSGVGEMMTMPLEKTTPVLNMGCDVYVNGDDEIAVDDDNESNGYHSDEHDNAAPSRADPYIVLPSSTVGPCLRCAMFDGLCLRFASAPKVAGSVDHRPAFVSCSVSCTPHLKKNIEVFL